MDLISRESTLQRMDKEIEKYPREDPFYAGIHDGMAIAKGIIMQAENVGKEASHETD